LVKAVIEMGRVIARTVPRLLLYLKEKLVWRVTFSISRSVRNGLRPRASQGDGSPVNPDFTGDIFGILGKIAKII
jgi:hypothetical protein